MGLGVSVGYEISINTSISDEIIMYFINFQCDFFHFIVFNMFYSECVALCVHMFRLHIVITFTLYKVQIFWAICSFIPELKIKCIDIKE